MSEGLCGLRWMYEEKLNVVDASAVALRASDFAFQATTDKMAGQAALRLISYFIGIPLDSGSPPGMTVNKILTSLLRHLDT